MLNKMATRNKENNNGKFMNSTNKARLLGTYCMQHPQLMLFMRNNIP